MKEIDKNQAQLLQQIVSLRNECMHNYILEIPEAIQTHLLFFGCKFFKDVAIRNFPKTKESLEKNYISISFDKMTTYADQLQSLISNLRRGTASDKELVWILERGVRFVTTETYIPQNKFENLYRDKKKITPHLKLGKYLESSDMLVVVLFKHRKIILRM